ncbi:hypothetical protein ACFE04_008854 [Oxalis oulophora]
MKEDNNNNNNTNNEAMFSKHHNQQQHPFSHHFQLSHDHHRHHQTTTDDGDGDSHSGGVSNKKAKTFSDPSAGRGDGDSIEVSRRPRGRPPGSKNKPKPPVFITRDVIGTKPAMSPYILEVPGGSDIVETISRFCRRKNLGLCVLTGSGAVSNVTLRQPSTTPGSTITFHGRFDILSISATFLQQTTSYNVPNVFTISLGGPQGQIVGGAVAGSLMAASTVYVVAATFNNPTYHRLPIDEEEMNNSGEGSPAGSVGIVKSGGGVGEGGQAVESCGGGGVAMYNCQIPGGGGGSGGGDVIWAPTPRPPHQQPPIPPY